MEVGVKKHRPRVGLLCPDPVKRLITRCWDHDPRRRHSCAEVVILLQKLLQQEQSRQAAL